DREAGSSPSDRFHPEASSRPAASGHALAHERTDESPDRTDHVLPERRGSGTRSMAPESLADPQTLSGEGVTTRLGGLLYLIHVLENLGLPDLFEAGWQLSSGAGP